MLLPYMDMAAILFNGAEPFEKKWQHPFNRRPHVKSDENCSGSCRKENILHNCIHCPRGKGDNPQGTKTLSPPIYILRLSPRAFLVLEMKILSVLPYMGMMPILFHGAEPFQQTGNNLSTEGPM